MSMDDHQRLEEIYYDTMRITQCARNLEKCQRVYSHWAEQSKELTAACRKLWHAVLKYTLTDSMWMGGDDLRVGRQDYGVSATGVWPSALRRKLEDKRDHLHYDDLGYRKDTPIAKEIVDSVGLAEVADGADTPSENPGYAQVITICGLAERMSYHANGTGDLCEDLKDAAELVSSILGLCYEIFNLDGRFALIYAAARVFAKLCAGIDTYHGDDKREHENFIAEYIVTKYQNHKFLESLRRVNTETYVKWDIALEKEPGSLLKLTLAFIDVGGDVPTYLRKDFLAEAKKNLKPAEYKQVVSALKASDERKVEDLNEEREWRAKERGELLRSSGVYGYNDESILARQELAMRRLVKNQTVLD